MSVQDTPTPVQTSVIVRNPANDAALRHIAGLAGEIVGWIKLDLGRGFRYMVRVDGRDYSLSEAEFDPNEGFNTSETVKP